MEAERGMHGSAQDAAAAQIAVGKRAGERLRHAKQASCPLRRRSTDRLVIAVVGFSVLPPVWLRQAEEMPRLVGDVAEIDEPAGLADEIEQIAVLAGRGIRPSASATVR